MKYRKKPVVIDAILFNEQSDMRDICKFMGVKISIDVRKQGIIIPTLEGDHLASFGDYIIKGVKGEFYPCKPDIFEMTYEIAE